jgi:hypothetical protein
MHCSVSYWYVFVAKDVRIRGYFSKPKGAREQNALGNTDLVSCEVRGALQQTTQVFWVVTPCQLVNSHRHFEGNQLGPDRCSAKVTWNTTARAKKKSSQKLKRQLLKVAGSKLSSSSIHPVRKGGR